MSRQAVADAIPPSARAIALLLASTPTVQDAQPGVLHQLLEFSNRYTAQVLSDALVYAEHAGRSGKVEMEEACSVTVRGEGEAAAVGSMTVKAIGGEAETVTVEVKGVAATVTVRSVEADV